MSAAVHPVLYRRMTVPHPEFGWLHVTQAAASRYERVVVVNFEDGCSRYFRTHEEVFLARGADPLETYIEMVKHVCSHHAHECLPGVIDAEGGWGLRPWSWSDNAFASRGMPRMFPLGG